jgi:alginate O-acetyltransferase complex protein AlgI
VSFTSVEFLLWLAVLAALYRAFPAKFRFAFLLISSYLFYYYSAGLLATILLAGVSLFTFAIGIWISRSRGRKTIALVLPIAIISLTAYLLLFKVEAALHPQGVVRWIMPLGLSYYTFKLISYVLDVYWDKMPAQRQLVPFLAYVAFFPQIVAGPIQRPDDFSAQHPRPGPVLPAFSRIAWGLAKKLIVADHLAPAVAYAFSHTTISHAPLWIGFYLWPLQLYADFSGLTDIAIGAGLLFGIRGPENFDRPFVASNIAEFWRRWHMSLTHWLVDYLFTPLRMATRAIGNVGLVLSITINMIAIGLWHGLSWGFFVFGVLHSVFMSVNALTTRLRKSWFKKHGDWDTAGTWLGRILTFHLVAGSLVFFRARSVADAITLLRNMLLGAGHGLAGLKLLDYSTLHSLLFGLVGYLILELCEQRRPDRWLRNWCESGPRFARWSVYGAVTILLIFGFALLLANGGGTKNPFIYAIF